MSPAAPTTQVKEVSVDSAGRAANITAATRTGTATGITRRTQPSRPSAIRDSLRVADYIFPHHRATNSSWSTPLRTVFVTTENTIAPLNTLRRLLNRDKDVSVERTTAPARSPAGRNAHLLKPAIEEDYTPPPGPPPGRNTVTAADGSIYGEEQLAHLVGEVKDYQITHGSLLKLVKHETESSVPTRGVGVSLLPTAFPRSRFDEALDLQHAFHELYVRVASDPDWLYAVLEPLIEHDAFIAALWDVYVRVRDADVVQTVVCGVFRSDYMLHQPYSSAAPLLKQVEINTFSCAGACHAERIANMHRRLGRVRGLHHDRVMEHLPENHNTQSIVTLLKLANNTYSSTRATVSFRAKCVLMTVQPFNFNIADERPIQYGLWDDGIHCYRCEWQTVLQTTTLTDDRTLLYRPPVGGTEYEVSVVYYRGGYEAAEYRDQSKETRVRLEMSRAIKCPDVLMHLTTCKSVQEALARPGAVERFLPFEKAKKVRSTFMYMQSLDESHSALEARSVALDLARAVNYVLKPNRDGGGHNVYRADIPAFLTSKPQKSWQNYVLMSLIRPPPTTGTLVMPQDLYHGATVSELGIVGTCLWERREGVEVEVIANDVAGWTFKTKPSEVDEMSVVKGYGCFDCPWLS